MADTTLIYKCKKNDRQAFNELVVKYQHRIFNLAYRMLGHHQEAEDVCQQAFINAYNNIKKFQKKSSFMTWVYQITVNLCHNYYRKNIKQPKTQALYGNETTSDATSGQLSWGEPGNPGNPGDNPQQVAQIKERDQLIQDALNTLNPELKSVIVLRDVEGHPYAEISRMLKCPVGTVRSRLTKAREELKDRLKNFV
ncbi:MAG: sigma-70 family RNA polymerase sigma factor [Planctomycetes bacterium]|nr:sigma-70 family RNA polymerase sigma factor [Planctomycetota bacterium]